MCIPPKAKKTRTIGPSDGHVSDEDNTDRGSETMDSVDEKYEIELIHDDDDKMHSGKGAAPIPFVNACYSMTCAPENADAVGFSANGTVLEIRDVSKFCHEVLPKYFRHNNFSSFVRQLNMYRFEKLRCVPRVEHAFRHPFFLRDQPSLLENVVRKASPRHRRAGSSAVTTSAADVSTPALVESPEEEVQKLLRMQQINAEYARALEWRNAQLHEEQAKLNNVMTSLMSNQDTLNEISRLFESPAFALSSADMAVLDSGVAELSRASPQPVDPFAGSDFDLGSLPDVSDDTFFLNELLA